MSPFTLGPLAFSATTVLVATAFAAALAAGRWAGRRERIPVFPALVDAFVVGMLAARLAFVVRWHEIYRTEPWSVIDIRDGGFAPWAGVAAATALVAWKAARKPAMRRPLAAALVASVLAGSATLGLLRLADPPQAHHLPDRTMSTLDGQPTTLAALAAGKPLVVNLWATWCPPCRREMPVLASAQRARPAIAFVFASQGESPQTVDRYLRASGLEIDNVVIDAESGLALDTGSRGLPVTFFYDSRGRLVDSHFGPLSAATLAAKLQGLGPP